MCKVKTGNTCARVSFFFCKIMYTKNKKATEKIDQSPGDNILSCQGKIKILPNREREKIDGLGGLDVIYR